MSAGDEQAIIKQYQPLIRALIPYEQQNKLLEGINKFSKRLPRETANKPRNLVLEPAFAFAV